MRCPNRTATRTARGSRQQRGNSYLRAVQQLTPEARDQFIASLDADPHWEEDCPALAEALTEAEDPQLAMMDDGEQPQEDSTQAQPEN